MNMFQRTSILIAKLVLHCCKPHRIDKFKHPRSESYLLPSLADGLLIYAGFFCETVNYFVNVHCVSNVVYSCFSISLDIFHQSIDIKGILPNNCTQNVTMACGQRLDTGSNPTWCCGVKQI